MKKNKKSKKIKNMIIFLSMLLLILIAFWLMISKYFYSDLNYIYKEDSIEEINIMPTNVDKLFAKYSGQVNQISIYKSMFNFVNKVVPDYHSKIKNMNNEQLEKYYKKNSNKIQIELGLENKEEFLEFAKNINILNGDEIVLESYTINPISVKSKLNSIECVLLIKYKNNEKIGFYLNILKQAKKTETPIIYNAGVTEDLMKYEYQKNNYESPVSDIIKSSGKVIK